MIVPRHVEAASTEISSTQEENETTPSLSDNSQENRNYAANKYIGTPINEEKDKGTYRVYAGDPNGLKLGPKGGQWHEYCEEVKRMQADTTCLFEINLDTTKHKVKKILYVTISNIFHHPKMSIASSSVQSKNDYKPGGTLIVTQGNFSGRVIHQGSDLLGRWT